MKVARLLGGKDDTADEEDPNPNPGGNPAPLPSPTPPGGATDPTTADKNLGGQQKTRTWIKHPILVGLGILALIIICLVTTDPTGWVWWLITQPSFLAGEILVVASGSWLLAYNKATAAKWMEEHGGDLGKWILIGGTCWGVLMIVVRLWALPNYPLLARHNHILSTGVVPTTPEERLAAAEKAQTAAMQKKLEETLTEMKQLAKSRAREHELTTFVETTGPKVVRTLHRVANGPANGPVLLNIADLFMGRVVTPCSPVAQAVAESTEWDRKLANARFDGLVDSKVYRLTPGNTVSIPVLRGCDISVSSKAYILMMDSSEDMWIPYCNKDLSKFEKMDRDLAVKLLSNSENTPVSVEDEAFNNYVPKEGELPIRASLFKYVAPAGKELDITVSYWLKGSRDKVATAKTTN